jgi:cold shock CspA family protein
VSPRGPVRGVVRHFDASEGLGEIELDDGRVVSFHATQLGDGSRSIAIGAAVTAELVAWHRGQLEATSVTVA